MNAIQAAGKTNFQARALLLGERLDLRAIGSVERLAADPMSVAAGACGVAVLFRYGAVVLFNVAPLEEGDFLRLLKPLVHQPYETPETESITITIDANAREGMEGGKLSLGDFSIERLQVVADILSKSTVLSMYEATVRKSFEMIEPFAVHMERHAIGRNVRELLRHIGTVLLSEHNMVGRVEVGDKPDLLWEHPELERLFQRLEDEFEIRERHLTLERKLQLVSRTAQTALDLLQDRRNLRVEWYIVILIVVEILLTLYEMFLLKH